MRKIIILNRDEQKDFFDFHYAFWLDVPLAKQSMKANSNATSSVGDITTDELNLIKSGSIVEEIGVEPFSKGTALGVVGSALISKYNVRQALLNAETKYTYFGTYWDGTSWTVKGA